MSVFDAYCYFRRGGLDVAITPTVLMVRHADVVPGSSDPGITADGVLACEALGQQLARHSLRVGCLVSSPLKRCRATGAIIARETGFRQCREPKRSWLSPLLGAPGAFVRADAQDEAGRAFTPDKGAAIRGLIGRVRDWKTTGFDRTVPPGFQEIGLAVSALDGLIAEAIMRITPGEVALLVTHDAILAPYAAAHAAVIPSEPASSGGVANLDALLLWWGGAYSSTTAIQSVGLLRTGA